MEQHMKESPYKHVIKYGLIIAGIPTIYHIALLFSGLHLDYHYYGEGIGIAYEKSRVSLIPAVLFIAFYFYRKNNSGIFKLIDAFILGLWIMLVNWSIVFIYTLIFRLIAVPDFTVQFYDINREKIFQELIDCCNYTSDALDSHERLNGNLWNSLLSGIFVDFIFALFYSLVFGVILRRKSQPTIDNKE